MLGRDGDAESGAREPLSGYLLGYERRTGSLRTLDAF
jgi:hypothetical protein